MPVPLQQADAVLAGDRAAERDRRVQHLVERGLGRGAGGVVAGRGDDQRVQVAVAGVRDGRDLHAVPGARSRSICASIAGTAERGTQTSSVSTGPSRSSAG